MTLLISDKIGFKPKIGDKKSDYIIKRSIQQEDTTFVNIYAPNLEAPEYIKEILTTLKEETAI